MPDSAIVSPSIHSTAAAAAMAQSPARRSSFSYALPHRSRIGMRMSVRISASPTTVSYGPTCNSRTGTVRLPDELRIVTLALSADSAAERSSAGSA